MSAVSVRFLGHAAVALEYDGTTVLIDPFLAPIRADPRWTAIVSRVGLPG